jgi:hypothetical protein
MDGLETMVVVIAVEMNPDGSVQSAKIDPSTDNGNPNWPVFAQSCLRALWKSSPLRMPKDKPYEAWRRLTLRTTGKEFIRIVMWNLETVDRFMSEGCLARSKAGARKLSQFSTQFVTPSVLRGEK